MIIIEAAKNPIKIKKDMSKYNGIYIINEADVDEFSSSDIVLEDGRNLGLCDSDNIAHSVPPWVLLVSVVNEDVK